MGIENVQVFKWFRSNQEHTSTNAVAEGVLSTVTNDLFGDSRKLAFTCDCTVATVVFKLLSLLLFVLPDAVEAVEFRLVALP